MSDNKELVDIWVVETNTIYREVPFTVVTDWIQQGRLLREDKVRPAGSQEWQLLAKDATLQVYFPRPEPQRAEDSAEALEAVEPEFAWKSSREGADDDVDMIPLIDVSLVLLIFFMMTAAVSSGVLSPIKTPPAKFELSTITSDMYWIGMDGRSPSGDITFNQGWPVPWYSAGKGNDTFDLVSELQLAEDDLRSLDPILKKLEKDLGGATGEVRVRLRGDEALSNTVIQQVTLELQKLEARLNAPRGTGQDKLSINVSGEVSEPQE